MTEDKIKDYNKLIADFLGWKLIRIEWPDDEDESLPYYQFQEFDKDGGVINIDIGGDSWSWYEGDVFSYDCDWKKLMSAVDYIEKLGYTSTIEKMTGKHENHRVWFNDQKTNQEVSTGARDEEKIIAVYLAVVYFIQWYDKNKTK